MRLCQLGRAKPGVVEDDVVLPGLGQDVVAGLREAEDGLGALTVSEAVLVLPASLPVTVWAPATVAVQLFEVQEPSGAIVKVVAAVTSPREFPAASKACAV